jgi:hypothetical protein
MSQPVSVRYVWILERHICMSRGQMETGPTINLLYEVRYYNSTAERSIATNRIHFPGGQLFFVMQIRTIFISNIFLTWSKEIQRK